jgi:DNA-binding transcriptional LysR family regulator
MTRQIDWESQVGRRLKLRHLRVFSTVVQCGSMAKAAAQLRVSQPTVSEVIAELEHTFGVRLLDRSTRGVEPTAYGGALLKRSVAAFDELKQSSRDIEFLADPTIGELRIGCPESLSAVTLLPVIRRYSELYPRVILHVDEVPSLTSQSSALRDRRLDLFLTRTARPLGVEEDLKVEPLFNDELVVAADMHSKWVRRRRKIGLAELVNEPWLLAPPHTFNHTRLAEAFHTRGLDMPRASIVTLSVPLRIHLLTEGSYITAFANSILRFYADKYGLKRLAVDLPYQPWPVVIVTLKNRTLSPVVDRFIECAREVAKSMAHSTDDHTTRRPKPNVT